MYTDAAGLQPLPVPEAMTAEDIARRLAQVAEGEGATSPVDVGLDDVAEVVAGDAHWCARTDAAVVYCWGSDDEGQLARAPTGRAARRMSDTRTIVVTAGPALTAKWLAPRMFAFATAHPEIELRFAATLRLLDFDLQDESAQRTRRQISRLFANTEPLESLPENFPKVVEMLRAKGVVGKFVEFFGEALDHLSLPVKAMVGNMAPEYGATMGFFPIDAETLRYLRFTGRAPEQVDAFLAPLPVRRLHGVGPAGDRALHELGVSTVAELRNLSLDRLIENFGHWGRTLYAFARGEDTREVRVERVRKSLSTEHTFETDIGDEAGIDEVLDRMADEVARGLEKKTLSACTVTVKARYPDFTTVTRSHSLPVPTVDAVF